MTRSFGRLRALGLAAGLGWVWLFLLLTPMHGNYDPGMPTAPEWAIERFLAGTSGKFISYRQSLFGLNVFAVYVFSAAALPIGLFVASLRWPQDSVHVICGMTVAWVSMVTLPLMIGFHLFAAMVAISGWGALIVGMVLTINMIVGFLWAGHFRARMRQA